MAPLSNRRGPAPFLRRSGATMAGPAAPSGTAETAGPSIGSGSGSHRHIFDYCLGTPRSVVSSHSGAIDIAVSLQEQAVFLPAQTVRGAAEHRRRIREQRTRQRNESAAGASQSGGGPAGVLTRPFRRSPGPTPPPQPPTAEASNTGNEDYFNNPALVRSTPSRTAAAQTAAPTAAAPATITAALGFGTNANSLGDGLLNYDPSTSPPPPHDGVAPPEFSFEDDLASQTPPSAMLRGSVVLKLAKPTRIKEFSLDFYGVSRTMWNLVPQPMILVDAPLPSSAEVEDVLYFGSHHWDFLSLDQYSAASPGYERVTEGQSASLVANDIYGASVAMFRDKPNQVFYRKQAKTLWSTTCQHTGNNGGDAESRIPIFAPMHPPMRKLKSPSVSAEGVVYPAGEYVYHFALVIDISCPESVSEPNGHIKYMLVPRVVRAGAFAPNLTGSMEISVIRSPPLDAEVLYHNPIQLSRVWDDRLVYSINLSERYLTLDVPAKLTVSLMPLPGGNVMVHQVRVYIVEMVAYVYSADPSIRTSDSSLRLVLHQRNASIETQDGQKIVGNLLHPTEPTHIDCPLIISTTSSKQISELPQAYGRGRLGEKRFVEPDMSSDYIRVKHHLVVTLRVSKLDPDDAKRHHFEVKIDTPINLLSKLCVGDNVRLPMYGDGPDNEPDFDADGLPTFDDALNHELVSPPSLPAPNSKDRQLHTRVPSSSNGETLAASASASAGGTDTSSVVNTTRDSHGTETTTATTIANASSDSAAFEDAYDRPPSGPAP